MKKLPILFLTMLFAVSCSNYTTEQEEAAKFVCECMEKDENGIGDPEMLYYICYEEQATQQFDKSVFADEGYANALHAICPEQNLVSEEE